MKIMKNIAQLICITIISFSFQLNITASESHDIEVDAYSGATLPVVYSITPTNGQYCQGSSITIGMNDTETSTTYILRRNGVTVTSKSGTGSAITFGTYSTVGTYTVIATNSDGSTTQNGSVLIKARPTKYTLQVPNGTEFCDGSAGALIKLSDSQTGVSYTLGYYSGTEAGPISGTGSSISFGYHDNTGPYNYYAKGKWTSGLACETQMNGTIVLTERPKPTVSISGVTSTCSEVPVSWTASGASTYSWNSSSEIEVENSSGSLVTITPVNTGSSQITRTYTVTGTNSYGCSASTSRSMYVNPEIVLNISGASEICSGSSTTLTASGSGLQYVNWLPSTGLSSTSGTSVTASPTSTTTYTITASNQGGCTKSVQFTLNVKSKPNVYTLQAPNGTEFCDGSSGALLRLSGSQTGASYTLYYYSGVEAGPISGTGSNLSFGYHDNTGPYNYYAKGKWTSGLACETNMSGSVVLTEQPKPTVSISGVTSTCSEVPVSWTASGASTYSWNSSSEIEVGNSSGSLVTITPVNTGSSQITRTYTVTGTNSYGCSASTSRSMYVNPEIVLNISGASEICEGSSTTLTASGSGLQYVNWSPSTGLSSTSGTSVTASPTSTTTYTVTASNQGGCTMSVQYTVNVKPKPNVYTLQAPNGTNFCEGTTGVPINLSGSQTGVNYILRYYSGVEAGPVSGTGGSISFGNHDITGSYNYSANAQWASGLACETNMSGYISLTERPKPTISISGDNTVCPGDATTFTASGASTYNWSPNIEISSTAGSSVTITPTTDRTYSVTGTDTYGCSNTASRSISMNPEVIVSIAGASEICEGSSTTLTASGQGVQYVSWSPSTGLSSTSGSTVTASPSSTTTYTVTGSNQGGCSGSTQYTLNVKPKPNVYTLQAPAGTGFCDESDGVELRLSGSQTGVSYRLYYYSGVEAGPIAGTGGSISFGNHNTIGSYNYSADARYSSGLACVTNMNGSISLSELPDPDISISGNTTTCTDVPVTWTASGAETYTWDASPELQVENPTGSEVTITPVNPGNTQITRTYAVTGTGNNGCMASVSRSMYVNPEIELSVSAADPQICPGSSTTLTASGSGLQYVNWSPSTGLSSTSGTTVTASPASTTTYTITANNQGGCSKSIEFTLDVKENPEIFTLQAPGGTQFCDDGDGVELTLSGSQTGVNYNLYYYIGLEEGPVAGTGNSISFGIHDIIGSYNYSATASWAEGLACETSMNGSIILSHFPDPDISISGYTSTCSEVPVSWTASGADSYTWNSSPELVVENPSGSEVTITPVNTTGSQFSRTYTVTGTDANGCIASLSRSMYVNPEIVFDITTPDPQICTGSSTTLTASGIGVQYVNWSPSTGLSSTLGTSVTAAPPTTTTYTVTASNQGGCTKSIQYTLFVKEKPAIYTLQAPEGTVFCDGSEGVELVLSGSQEGVNYYLGYYTNTEEAGPIPGNMGSISFGIHDNISYSYYARAIWMDMPNCESYMNGDIQLTRWNNPVIEISGKGDVFKGNSVIWTASGAATYNWSPNVDISSVTNPLVTITPSESRTYTLTGYDSHGCFSEISRSVNVHDPLSTILYIPNTPVYSQSTNLTDHNYIYKVTPRSEMESLSGITFDNAIEQVTYFDGLGREEQTVQIQANPSGYDIYTYTEYDQFGRKQKQFLPYIGYTGGTYRSLATLKSVTQNLYAQTSITIEGHEAMANGEYYFGKTVFENAPLNRVLEQGSSGQVWQPLDESGNSNGHTLKQGYSTNTNSINSWKYIGDSWINIYFPANSLYIKETKNENWISGYPGGVTMEYKDKQGKIIQKTFTLNDGTTLTTKYVYDNFGLLRCVIPPLAMSPTSSDLCYYYTYDERGRMISKKIPGADLIEMVYDVRDRLVASRDGNQKEKGLWIITKYDEIDRPVMTAEYHVGSSRASLQSLVNYYTTGSALNAYVDFSSPSDKHGYVFSGLGATITEDDVLTVNYYDQYYYSNYQNAFVAADNFGLDHEIFQDFDTEKERNTTGLITITKVRNLESNTFYRSSQFYDEWSRIIQIAKENHLGGSERISTKYDFAGKIQATIHEHIDGDHNLITEGQRYVYDHTGRLLEKWHQIAGQTEKMLSANKYNRLGELVSKYQGGFKIGSNIHVNQKIDYTYNIRGWMTKINDPIPGNLGNDIFAMHIHYNDLTEANGLTTQQQFNGNISALTWNDGFSNEYRGYGFTYDKTNRLKTAIFGYNEGGIFINPSQHYNVSGDDNGIRYDKNGNIINLIRFGVNANTIDDLTYIYAGNRLIGIDDYAVDPDEGFYDRTTSIIANPQNEETWEYLYDKSGNIIWDWNKEVMEIDYNFLNLPRHLTLGNTMMDYVYDASGTKLQKILDPNGAPDRITDYADNFIYEDGELEYILISEGRILTDGTDIKYEYHLKDHLGNVRAVYTEDDEDGESKVKQVSDFYPFGMRHRPIILEQADQNYLYNSKEYQTEMGWYDYGTRMYNPFIGRFNSIDHITSDIPSISPYQYASNNPVWCIDIDGLEGFPSQFFNEADFYPKPDNTYVYIDTYKYQITEKTIQNNGVANLPTNQTYISEYHPRYSEDFMRYQRNVAENQRRINEHIETGKALYPTQFGGGDFGFGTNQGLIDAFKAAPEVVLPEIAFAELAKLRLFKQYKNIVKTLDVATDSDQAVFYSGPGNRALATKFAEQNGKITLEMTNGGKWLESKNLYEVLTKEQADEIWSLLSKRFAEGSSGQVNAFVEGASSKGIFETVEYPALLKNENITNILTGGH